MITVFRHIDKSIICCFVFLSVGGFASADYVRTGPASGGGLEPSAGGASDGTVLSSSEFRKLNCQPGETRVGRDTYYTCEGRTYKKDLVKGCRAYVLVSGIPY